MASYDGTDEFMDSRDIDERIAELTDEIAGTEYGYADERDELAALEAFRDSVLSSGYGDEWPHGMTFIRDDDFEDYAKEFARDIGAISGNEGWPLDHIDWTAATEALQQDYNEFEFQGSTYYAR